MSNQLATLNTLAPIAKRLRERQLEIEDKLGKWNGITAELVADAAEQGRDILDAKTKLGKALRWSEWLHAHVPNLSEAQAGKYERIAVEQLRDPRQCVFAFLPPPEREDKPDRSKPAAWETAWASLSRFKTQAAGFDGWPTEQVELTRKELEPVARVLWPERFA